jgi:hypothetical protein
MKKVYSALKAWRVSGLWTHPEAVSLRLKEVCREESRIFAGEEAV